MKRLLSILLLFVMLLVIVSSPFAHQTQLTDNSTSDSNPRINANGDGTKTVRYSSI